MPPTTTRLQDVTALYTQHSESLKRLVAKRTTTDPDTIEDACSFAWTQLLTHDSVDLTPPHWRSLAWLTQTAMREAWRVHERAMRTIGADDTALETSPPTAAATRPAPTRSRCSTNAWSSSRRSPSARAASCCA